MKIRRMQITVEPRELGEDMLAVEIKITADGNYHTLTQYIHECHFVSLFDQMFDAMKIEIKRAILK